MTYRTAVRIAMALLVASTLVLPVGAVDSKLQHSSDPGTAYHLRIVRVSGPGTDPGAAVRWGDQGGVPVTEPTDEIWGSSVQLDGLARALAGTRADAVTGFFVISGDDGVEFERDVIVGDAVLPLRFRAHPVDLADGTSELELRLGAADPAEPPLAEARLRVRTNRTVAIASPTPVDDDWLVLAVTVVDQGRLVEPLERNEAIVLAGVDGVGNPRLIEKVDPRYPEAARREKLEGDVVVQAVIDEQGIVRAPMVLRMSEGAEELAASAVDAVSRWRYEPATRDGKPVAAWFTIFVQFRLS